MGVPITTDDRICTAQDLRIRASFKSPLVENLAGYLCGASHRRA